MNIEKSRFHMIEQQIRPWNVFDPTVLNLMASLPREQFVAAEQKSLAFADLSLELGHGQLMFSPKQEARMLQELALSGDDKILEVGTGSGFTAALMASQAYSVLTVDIHDDFITKAQKTLQTLKLNNVDCEVADIDSEWQPPLNYDVVVITAKVITDNLDQAPQSLNRFLSWLGASGKLFLIEGNQHCSHAYLYQKSQNELSRQRLFELDTPAIIRQKSKHSFVF
ncbi:MAG: protein-L-isoaspartate O-methyltransferase [Kangiellaceae bacterium]|jgi:protein-L-isoaspartate(D-aspartate) O-methyltransferase|nr:protein-L-isoaspartate O-methyltransferase [Kangiellaceae bacterium]